MATESVTKKRGRPKKADKIATSTHEQLEATSVTTSKQSTKSRSVATAKTTSSTSVTPKKSSRRKKVTNIDEAEDGESQPTPSAKTTTAQKAKDIIAEQTPVSAVLNEAKAFAKLKQSAASQGQGDRTKIEQQVSSKDSDVLPSASTPPEAPSEPSTSARSISIPSTKSASTPSSPALSEAAKNNDTRSSFLSGFLSDTSNDLPEADESAKISDRSAFKSQSFSIDDIVSGAGVSDLATLTAAIEEKANAKKPRQSAIPINPPKAFKSHSLRVFPDKPEQQKAKASPAQKYINPEGYSLGSFQKFKTAVTSNSTTSTQPAFTASTAPKDPPLAPKPQSPHIPPTITTAQSPSQTQPQQPSHKVTLKPSSSSPPPPPTQPQSFPKSALPPPPPAPTQPPSRPSLLTPSTPSIPAHLRPKRPTEMTAAELLKDGEFKSLRRKWTGVIVGIPVLVVTSYLLWDRLDKEEKARGWGVPTPMPVDVDRRRGEMPRRILDDGALDRDRAGEGK